MSDLYYSFIMALHFHLNITTFFVFFRKNNKKLENVYVFCEIGLMSILTFQEKCIFSVSVIAYNV